MHIGKKIIIPTFIFFCFISIIPAWYNYHQSHKKVNYNYYDWKITQESGKKLAKIYKMNLSGWGGATMDCIRGMSISFDVHRLISKNEAREIIINCAREFSKNINAYPDIRPYLIEYPFPESLLSISISISDSNGHPFYDPELAYVSLHHGKLLFAKEDINQPTKYSKETETLEEAKQELMRQ